MTKEQINIRLPAPLAEKLEQVAQTSGLSYSAVVTIALERYIAEKVKNFVELYGAELAASMMAKPLPELAPAPVAAPAPAPAPAPVVAPEVPPEPVAAPVAAPAPAPAPSPTSEPEPAVEASLAPSATAWLASIVVDRRINPQKPHFELNSLCHALGIDVAQALEELADPSLTGDAFVAQEQLDDVLPLSHQLVRVNQFKRQFASHKS